eukprot:COSAG02_NODE_5898_length_3953_cov_6.796575_1_plen_158_part_10
MRALAGRRVCCLLVLLLASAGVLPEVTSNGDSAVLTVDKDSFFETFEVLYKGGWIEEPPGGGSIVAVMEHILGARLDERSRAVCDDVFAKVSSKWRGSSMPPTVFSQMLRNAAEPLGRVLLATSTTTPHGASTAGLQEPNRRESLAHQPLPPPPPPPP